MGAKTGLLVYADGDVPGRLGQVGEADLGRTTAMMRRLYPGWMRDCRLEPVGRVLPSGRSGLRGKLARGGVGLRSTGDGRSAVSTPG